jgi:hypothetical protein
MNSYQECPVCFETHSAENFTTQICEHSFCKTCISKLDLCPICRTNWKHAEQYESYRLCNTDAYSAQMSIRVNKQYIFLLPNKKIKLLVCCINKAWLAADMEIISATQNERFIQEYVGNSVSYCFREYNTIHLDSFLHKEELLIYTS